MQFGLDLPHCSLTLNTFNLIRQMTPLSVYPGIFLVPCQGLKYFFRVLCSKTPFLYLFNSWINCENLIIWLFKQHGMRLLRISYTYYFLNALSLCVQFYNFYCTFSEPAFFVRPPNANQIQNATNERVHEV